MQFGHSIIHLIAPLYILHYSPFSLLTTNWTMSLSAFVGTFIDFPSLGAVNIRHDHALGKLLAQSDYQNFLKTYAIDSYR